MGTGLRETLTEADLAKLARAMDWVIPPDSSPGAGTEAGINRLIELIDSQYPGIAAMYAANLPGLTESDLADSANSFAQLFIEQVRDVYYSFPETGSWADIGFKVTDP